MPGRRHTSSLTEEAHLPPAAPASRAATPRIVAPPNTATHSLANSEANSPRIMAEPPPGLRLPLPLLALTPGNAQAEGGAGAGAATSGAPSNHVCDRACLIKAISLILVPAVRMLSSPAVDAASSGAPSTCAFDRGESVT